MSKEPVLYAIAASLVPGVAPEEVVSKDVFRRVMAIRAAYSIQRHVPIGQCIERWIHGKEGPLVAQQKCAMKPAPPRTRRAELGSRGNRLGGVGSHVMK